MVGDGGEGESVPRCNESHGEEVPRRNKFQDKSITDEEKGDQSYMGSQKWRGTWIILRAVGFDERTDVGYIKYFRFTLSTHSCCFHSLRSSFNSSSTASYTGKSRNEKLSYVPIRGKH
jgi:hypothetical protein